MKDKIKMEMISEMKKKEEKFIKNKVEGKGEIAAWERKEQESRVDSVPDTEHPHKMEVFKMKK